ncbi:HD-GYP domain-containing protein [Pseudomonas sp. NCCP-436]|uniref:HD-GYP domain-containing protein n=1 Tax=Pseudomonas sp. NCCP-436 TaxID=2842481 RepID=UPI001C82381A|nr:HD domain-containing phosphohydrolase [Pseudomonas sp. NCCP-436]GIZ11638.1 two-component system response regulator [Pseudomonas sp. NCCP-436]
MQDMLDRPERELILVVDESQEARQKLGLLLMEHYQIRLTSEREALAKAREMPLPDLILLGLYSDYYLCRLLKSDPLLRDIPLILVTASNDTADEQLGFDLGAADYIVKPASAPIVLARVRAQLQLKGAADYLRDKNEYLELEIRRRTRDIQNLQDVTIEAMASLALMRDNPCSRRLRRIERYMIRLVVAFARQQPALSQALTAERITQLGKSAKLYMIDRLTLPDRILLRHAEPDETDLRLLREGVLAGRDALERAERRLGGAIDFLSDARDIVYGQHERWDGKGYPQGLHGEQIPLSARLMALVAAFEDLTCPHPYLPQVAPEQAVKQICADSGTRFDPMVVLAFVEAAPAFIRIARVLADAAAAMDCELQRLEDALAESIDLAGPLPD